VLFKIPRPSISISTLSPSFKNTAFGLFNITPADEIQDAQNLKLTTKINGELRQNSSTSKMFIKIPEIISKISKVMTLEKGDIIATGTPAGVMLNNPNAIFLKDGDRVEMEIEGLGILNNTIKFVKSD